MAAPRCGSCWPCSGIPATTMSAWRCGRPSVACTSRGHSTTTSTAIRRQSSRPPSGRAPALTSSNGSSRRRSARTVARRSRLAARFLRRPHHLRLARLYLRLCLRHPARRESELPARGHRPRRLLRLAASATRTAPSRAWWSCRPLILRRLPHVLLLVLEAQRQLHRLLPLPSPQPSPPSTRRPPCWPCRRCLCRSFLPHHTNNLWWRCRRSACRPRRGSRQLPWPSLRSPPRPTG